jgi:electron transfer flavoprotein beta subunit
LNHINQVKEVKLKIVVCVKQVPDSAAKMDVQNGGVSWGDAPIVLNPWDEYAVESALQIKESLNADVTVISVGDEGPNEALKTALAMGCDQAILISDSSIAEADSQSIAKILAAAIKKVEDVGIVFFGRQAIDGDMGVTSAQTARVLGFPMVSHVSLIEKADAESNTIQVHRSIEEGRQIIEADLPAVLSVSKDIGEPRYPSFMGIRKASRANIPIWSLEDLEMEAPQSVIKWPEIHAPVVREITTEIIDGDSPQDIAEKLADKIMGEKVL